MTRRIVVADDHPIFRKGLVHIVRDAFKDSAIEEAQDGLEAVKLTVQTNPHLVVLDIEMPRLNGLHAAERILNSQPSAKVVILTMHDNSFAFDRAMEIGAMGFVLKENAASDMVHCIEQVFLDKHYVSPQLRDKMSASRKEAKNFARQLEALSPAEKRVLRLIADFKTSRVIGEELFLSERTIQNHRLNIARKLQLNGSHQVLRFAIEYTDLIALGVER
jgi:DNA-binding NarL/FixJ family response regulator